jgi:hypothetical protein
VATSGGFEDVTVLNGSFEMTSLEPGCHGNLSNEEFTDAVDFVTAFGTSDQVDLYSDCFDMASDGLFLVGLGAVGDQSDAIALELSGALSAGGSYRLRFFASFGATGGATSTNVQVGTSSSPDTFGTLVSSTGQLPDDPTEFEMTVPGVGSTFLTMQVEPDGDLGWAMVDDVRIELIP